MTAKRFMIDDAGELIDLNNHKFIDYGEECCNLLNELHEENQYLKSLKWNQDCIKEISISIQQKQLLEKENEQLKTTIQQLRTDNTKQKKQLNTTMKENEQLKCGNKNLKATLNDFINILNRLQSNPTDKQTVAVARDMLQNMGKELEE